MYQVRPHQRGFSVVEILIVVGLMTLLAGIVIPTFHSGTHSQLVSAADLLVAELDYARQLAVSNDTTYQFTFELPGNRFFFEHSGTDTTFDFLPSTPFRRQDDPGNRQYTLFADAAPRLGIKVHLHAVYKLSPQPVAVNDLEFGPLGASARSEETVVWLRSGTGDSQRYISIHIHPVTGLATVGMYTRFGPGAIVESLGQQSANKWQNQVSDSHEIQFFGGSVG